MREPDEMNPLEPLCVDDAGLHDDEGSNTDAQTMILVTGEMDNMLMSFDDPGKLISHCKTIDTCDLESAFRQAAMICQKSAVSATQAFLRMGFLALALVEKTRRGGGRGKKGLKRGAILEDLAEKAGLSIHILERAVTCVRKLTDADLTPEQWQDAVNLRPGLIEEVLKTPDITRALKQAGILNKQGHSDTSIRKMLHNGGRNPEPLSAKERVTSKPDYMIELLSADARDAFAWLSNEKHMSRETILNNAITMYAESQ